MRGRRGREEVTHRVRFAGVSGCKGDRVAWDAPFAEEHAGQKRADQGACARVGMWRGRRARLTTSILAAVEARDLCARGRVDERQRSVVQLSGGEHGAGGRAGGRMRTLSGKSPLS